MIYSVWNSSTKTISYNTLARFFNTTLRRSVGIFVAFNTSSLSKKLLKFAMISPAFGASVAAPLYDKECGGGDAGWDNPFRPDGDLSKEADKIVTMILDGKTIDYVATNGNGVVNEENGRIQQNVCATNNSQTQWAHNNGTSSHNKAQASKDAGNILVADSNGVTSASKVSKLVVPGPISASHVLIDEKKSKRRKGCCTIQ